MSVELLLCGYYIVWHFVYVCELYWKELKYVFLLFVVVSEGILKFYRGWVEEVEVEDHVYERVYAVFVLW